MERPELSDEERAMLKAQLARLISDTDELLREGTRLLGKLTNLLGVALSPRLSSGVLERLDIVPVSSSRLLFVLSIEEGPVKTIVLGFEADVPRAEIDRVVSMLNERLTGLTLAEIRDTCEARLRTIEDSTGIVRLVVDRARPLFGEPKATRLRVGGTQNILNQPEFQEPDEVRRLIQLIEDEDSVVELIENLSDASTDAIGQAFVSIGSESSADAADWLSIITSPYRLGETTGTLGVIGPTRMDYPRAVALVENMAAVLNDPSGRPDAATGSSAAQLSA
jgi:heat-inducible transcriptional repressor